MKRTNKEINKEVIIPASVVKKGSPFVQGILLPRKVILQIADEVAKRVKKSRSSRKTVRIKIDNPLFLDTSAIIDGRFFDLIKLGVFYGNFVLLESVLSELKNIADSKDDVKKSRGRQALKYLDEIKKQRNVKLVILKDEENNLMVDDKIIQSAKKHRGRIITCDYNLSKKARISGLVSVDIHEIANVLKTQAVPGEAYWIKVVQRGKVEGQGVGYLPDGTMIVVEKGADSIGKTIHVVISRIIQTDAGKILFSKIQENGNTNY